MKHEETYKIICEEMNLDYITAMDLKAVRIMDYKDSRNVFFYVTRITTNDSFKKMASFFDKDHATAIHGVKCIKNLLENNTFFIKLVEKILSRISYLKITNAKFQDKVSVLMNKEVYNNLSNETKSKFIKTDNTNEIETQTLKNEVLRLTQKLNNLRSKKTKINEVKIITPNGTYISQTNSLIKSLEKSFDKALKKINK